MNDNLSEKIIQTFITEQRRTRRWKNIRTFTWIFLALLFLLLIFVPGSKFSSSDPTKPYVSLVELNGVIMPGSEFSAKKMLPVLQKAFEDKNSKGVVLVVNSPGGSPVQASIIHDKILQLKKKYNKKVVVVGQDIMASGAYLVASAADKIYVNADTLTGSIGVIMNGFGFDGLLDKIGVSRRVFTAGDNKDRLDPFTKLRPEDVVKINQVLNEVHQDFINDVEQGRAGKLKGDKTELFSGDFWTGTTAVKLGLADGIGNLWEILPAEFKVEHYKRFRSKPSLVEALTNDVGTELNLGLTASAPKVEALLK